MKIKESQQEKTWGNSKCKGPGAGMSLVNWRSSEEVSVAAGEGASGES